MIEFCTVPDDQIWIISGNLQLKTAYPTEELVLFPFHKIEKVLYIYPTRIYCPKTIITEEGIQLTLHTVVTVQISLGGRNSFSEIEVDDFLSFYMKNRKKDYYTSVQETFRFTHMPPNIDSKGGRKRRLVDNINFFMNKKNLYYRLGLEKNKSNDFLSPINNQGKHILDKLADRCLKLVSIDIESVEVLTPLNIFMREITTDITVLRCLEKKWRIKFNLDLLLLEPK